MAQFCVSCGAPITLGYGHGGARSGAGRKRLDCLKTKSSEVKTRYRQRRKTKRVLPSAGTCLSPACIRARKLMITRLSKIDNGPIQRIKYRRERLRTVAALYVALRNEIGLRVPSGMTKQAMRAWKEDLLKAARENGIILQPQEKRI